MGLQLVIPETISLFDITLIGVGVLAVLLLSTLIVSVKRLTAVVLEQGVLHPPFSPNASRQVVTQQGLSSPDMLFHSHPHPTNGNFIQPAFLIGTTEVMDGDELDLDPEAWEVDVEDYPAQWEVDDLPEDLQERLRTFQNTLANLQERVVADSEYERATSIPDSN